MGKRSREDESTDLTQLDTDGLLVRLYRANQETERRLTTEIHNVALDVAVVTEKLDNIEGTMVDRVKIMMGKQLESCKEKFENISPSKKTVTENIKNPYTIGAGLVALAGAITAAIQAFN